MMAPVTPSPRRGTVKRLSDLQRKDESAPPSSGNDGPYHGIPLPPLYYMKAENNENKSKSIKEGEYIYRTPDKKNGNRTAMSSRAPSKSSFMPIERPPLSRSNTTPPVSPLIGKQIFSSEITSPALSAGSVAPTEDMTEGTLTPTPASSYLQAVAISPYTISHQSRQVSASQYPRSFGRSPSSGGGAFGPPLSPRKSPNKYLQQRRSSGSPLPYSPSHQSPTPYSPGASSIGSHSTTTTADDAVRRQRVKTELCMHYKKSGVCPFGSSCTFAHGEAELQKTTLMDLQRAGLIEDTDTYRTKPCLTWVATGSCPFGKRCSSVHDPRVIGPVSSWLPHTETQGNSMNTDINVDALHQKRLSTILYDNPFGEHLSMEMDEFADLYKVICNNTNNNKRRRNNLSETHRIAIALKMRGSHGWSYKYCPQHVIYDEMCMVLQKRAFRLEKSGNVIPIALSTYNPKNSQHVSVREIAFGPDSDNTVREVALWFNIPEREVTECNPQLAKRYRWKKAPKFDDQRALDKRPSVFDSRECFIMIRPFERDAFDLATKILCHRFETVKAERLTTLKERFETLKTLQSHKDDLQETFQNHKRSWVTWAWPINTGRQSVDHDTPVPQVDSHYNPLLDEEAMERAILAAPDDEVDPVKGSAIEPIWASFVSTDFDRIESEDLIPAPASSHCRLSIFEKLAEGLKVCPNRSLPHISRSFPEALSRDKERKSKPIKSDQVPDRQSEQCWKALLLKESHTFGSNEWQIVREHFQNARCKKVLNIIQK